jgi:hypothetical protein
VVQWVQHASWIVSICAAFFINRMHKLRGQHQVRRRCRTALTGLLPPQQEATTSRQLHAEDVCAWQHVCKRAVLIWNSRDRYGGARENFTVYLNSRYVDLIFVCVQLKIFELPGLKYGSHPKKKRMSAQPKRNACF